MQTKITQIQENIDFMMDQLKSGRVFAVTEVIKDLEEIQDQLQMLKNEL